MKFSANKKFDFRCIEESAIGEVVVAINLEDPVYTHYAPHGDWYFGDYINPSSRYL